MYLPHDLSAVDLSLAIGCITLVALAVLPRPRSVAGKMGPALIAAVFGLVLGVWGIHELTLSLGFWPTTETRAYTAYNIEEIQQRPEQLPPNVILIEGGSYAARGINCERLETALADRGYPTKVIQFARAGAPHLERAVEWQHFVRHAGPAAVREMNRRNLLWFSEVARAYDLNPVAQLSSNLFTTRTLAYLQPSIAIQAFEALWLSHQYDGTQLPPKETLVNVFQHGLLNTFNIGMLHRYEHWTSTKTIEPRFLLDRTNKNFQYRPIPLTNYLSEFPKAATNPPLDLRWRKLFEADVAATGLKPKRVFFATPTRDHGTTIHIARFESTFKNEPIITLAGERELYNDLETPAAWYDYGHMTATGANRYTDWLAKKIIAKGLVVH